MPYLFLAAQNTNFFQRDRVHPLLYNTENGSMNVGEKKLGTTEMVAKYFIVHLLPNKLEPRRHIDNKYCVAENRVKRDEKTAKGAEC